MRQEKKENRSENSASHQPELPVQLNSDPFIPVSQLTGTHPPIQSFANSTTHRPTPENGTERTSLQQRQAEEATPAKTSSSNETSIRSRLGTQHFTKKIPTSLASPDSATAIHDETEAFGLTEFDRALVRRKAWQLVGKYGYHRHDLDDIQQELTLQLLKSAVLFEPTRSHRNVFATVVVDRQVASMVRRSKAEKRDYRRRRNFTDLNNQSNSNNDWLNQFPEPKRCLFPDLNRAELDEVEQELPDELRELFSLLKKMNLTEIQRQTGTSRYILLKQTARLRRILIAAGIDYSQPEDN